MKQRMCKLFRKSNLFVLAAILAVVIACPIAASAEDNTMSDLTPLAALRLPVEGTLPSLNGAVEWLNSKPLTPAGLRGKVILVDFWTYTCVNWTRTAPYVRAWSEKYKDKGLVVIGVHTPEFPFEKNIANIRQAMKEMKVDYPVAVDSNYGVWNAFDNEYWPAVYIVDAQGRIRFHHFGEGAYDETESVIQQLLVEAGAHDVGRGTVSVDPKGLELAADEDDLQSPETYTGYARADSFAGAGGAVLDRSHVYTLPAALDLNTWALSGDWTFGKVAVVANKANARIAYRFHARDVNLIMSPPKPGTSARFRVFVDGHAPGAAHGTDVDAEGYGTVSEQRTYQLIRQPKPIVTRTIEIKFLDPGTEAFDFTFG